MTPNSLAPYERWRVGRWETPFSNAKELLLNSLCDGKNDLTIQFSDRDEKKYIISFPPFCCYRSINESFRNELWRLLKEKGQLGSLGNSWIVEESDFLGMLREDPIWLSQNSEAKHYLVVTAEDVIEIVSSVEPTVFVTG